MEKPRTHSNSGSYNGKRSEILRLEDIPPLAVTQNRLLTLLNDDTVDLLTLAAAIEEDPSLTARIIGLPGFHGIKHPFRIVSCSIFKNQFDVRRKVVSSRKDGKNRPCLQILSFANYLRVNASAISILSGWTFNTTCISCFAYPGIDSQKGGW